MAPMRQPFSQSELNMIRQMLAKGFNAPLTSSAGRLFDAVASILGLRQRAHFEGQAAMELEFAVQPGVEAAYFFELIEGRELIVDWQPMMLQMLDELRRHQPVAHLAAVFHNTLAEMVVAVARRAGVRQVVLTGGCFQNKYLLERTVRRLQEKAFRPFWHQRIPPNDGGIALGQVMGAVRSLQGRRETTEECCA
jgi:hydrogenase maturation protein HypF